MTAFRHTGTMIPFLVAEAVRRVRRRSRDDRARQRPGLPTWRLVTDEVQHLAMSRVVTPRAAAAVCGTVTALGVMVALGPTYPGPVAPAVVRWLLAAILATSTFALARSAPPRFRDLRRMVRRARVGFAAVGAAAAITVIKVGLHDVTPGPVLPGTARWVAATVVVMGAVLLAAGRDRASGS